MFELSIESELPSLKSLLAKLEPAALRGALKNIGEAGVGLATDAFNESTDPYGKKWAPLSEGYLKSLVGASRIPGRRRRESFGTRPLVRTGALLRSLNWRLVGAGAVSIGVSQRYGVYHQGDPNHPSKGLIPRRMFLPTAERGLPDEWREEMIDAVEAFLDVGGDS